MELAAQAQQLLQGRGGGGGEAERDRSNAATAAAAAAASAAVEAVTIFPSLSSAEAMEAGLHQTDRSGEEKSPKKRAYALAAFFATLSFAAFALNLAYTFANDLLGNPRVLNYVASKFNLTCKKNE